MRTPPFRPSSTRPSTLFLILTIRGASAQNYPEFPSGDECLFCHRNSIGPEWPANPHNRTIRPGGSADEFLLGDRPAPRKLRRSGYGRFDLLEGDRWNPSKFAARCAGCHATAVDPQTGAFAAPSLDCVVCHGVVDLKHSGDTRLVLFSKARQAGAGEVASTCGACHLRGARWTTPNRPYPTLFLPPADLFSHITFDPVSTEDRHVSRSVQQIRSDPDSGTCLSCHTVHGNQTTRHRRAPPSAMCNDCHLEGRPRKELAPRIRRSTVCEY